MSESANDAFLSGLIEESTKKPKHQNKIEGAVSKDATVVASENSPAPERKPQEKKHPVLKTIDARYKDARTQPRSIGITIHVRPDVAERIARRADELKQSRSTVVSDVLETIFADD